MHKKLLIVESPAKAKTINKYLGNEFLVIASFGHVRELVKKSGSIDVDNQFKAKYQLIAKNKKHIDEIVANSKKCDYVYLATDPDREGEAISWHIKEVLAAKKIQPKLLKRVVFNEITAQAVKNAINNPRDLDDNLINAQQARVTLDYLIGFNVSPLLWRKIRPNLSAGRVQSPALSLICEREEEIKAFIAEDYFSINLTSIKDKALLKSKLIQYNSRKIEQRTLTNKDEAHQILDYINTHKQVTVTKVIKKQKKKHPLAPFITSSLQIEASRKLGYAPDKTMRLAQGLYEGIDIGNETIGLITYMRTDSVNLADSAIEEIRQFITKSYPSDYLPKTAQTYTSKVKNAQEAHEAIRPTLISKTPEELKTYLTNEQYKLYQLIWLRTLASQMSSAILDTTAIDLTAGDAVFRLNGILVNFDGFMHIYDEDKEANTELPASDIDDNIKLPNLIEGEALAIKDCEILEHQTQPKPRYSEASLIKTLEELGIGRPSTYASIIYTLKKREYVTLEKKRFIPTDIGSVVSKFLINHLSKYVDYHFTAKLEDTLDEISNGQLEKQPVLSEFWQELQKTIAEKSDIPRAELTAETLDEDCPECKSKLLIKLGKYGKFIGCSNYPKCNYMRKQDSSDESVASITPELIPDRKCPQDEGDLVIRSGRYGKFISCKNYPKCKYIENINQPDTDNNEQANIKCPECSVGFIVAKKNRFGNLFYACNNYPKCKTLFNNKPLDEECPECNYKILMHKTTKTKGEQKLCPKCSYTISIA